MLENDPISRELIAHALGKAIDDGVKEHLSGISQEPQITSRIAERLEQLLDGNNIRGHQVEIITQDIPDRGPRSLEKALGADLYVGISVTTGGKQQTKGFFTQAKISDKLRTQSDYEDLDTDCKDMLDRSESSYVWLYERGGVRIVRANDVLKRGQDSTKKLKRRRAATVFSSALECKEGDFSIGLPLINGTRADQRSALGEMLEELRIPKGVGVLISR